MKIISISLLIALIATSLGAGYLLRNEHQKEASLLRSALSEGVEHRLDVTLGAMSQSIIDFVKDFGGWDLVGDFVGRPDKKWGDANIGAAASKKGVDLLWLYNENLDVVYSYSAGDTEGLSELPITKADMKSLLTKSFPINFFVSGDHGAIEIFAGRIEPASAVGKIAKPFGYIFAAQRWTAAKLKDLSNSTNTLVSVEPAGWNTVPDTLSAVTFFRPLVGWNGEPILTLKATKGAEILEAFEHLRTKMIAICLGYGFTVLVIALLLALQFIRLAARSQAVLKN